MKEDPDVTWNTMPFYLFQTKIYLTSEHSHTVHTKGVILCKNVVLNLWRSDILNDNLHISCVPVSNAANVDLFFSCANTRKGSGMTWCYHTGYIFFTVDVGINNKHWQHPSQVVPRSQFETISTKIRLFAWPSCHLPKWIIMILVNLGNPHWQFDGYDNLLRP